jgi:hypothetical protein
VISTKWAPWVRRSSAAEASKRLAEEIWPLRAIAVAGEDDRRALVALVDHVVEILGARRAQRLESEVVEDQEIRPGVAREALGWVPSARPPARCRSILAVSMKSTS